jgi:hypothetical protein
MSTHLKTLQPFLWSLGRNAIAGVVFWILALGLVQFGERVLGGWPAAQVGELLACVVGAVVALRLRAGVTAYFVAAMAAFSASELAIHSYYGIRAAQGAPTHFAVMGAGILGVALGALLMTRGRGASGVVPAALGEGSSRGTAVADVDGPKATVSERQMWEREIRQPCDLISSFQ